MTVGVPSHALEVFGDELGRAEAYADMLVGRGVEWGLIGPRETDRIWARHVLNSVAVAGWIGQNATVVDVGSGAGLPGIPLALARPDLRVTLLEPMLRRVNFLATAVAELGLEDRVEVVRARAEDHRLVYDVATCRAVAPLPRLLSWTRHLFWPDGSLVALKGQTVDQELTDAADELRFGGLRAHASIVQVAPGVDEARVVVVERV